MDIAIKHYEAKFKKDLNPKVGLIALSTDQTIEKDFKNICNNLPLDIFINRIHNQNPLTWLDTMLNGVEHMNFFEGRATEYSKASTRGTWGEVFA